MRSRVYPATSGRRSAPSLPESMIIPFLARLDLQIQAVSWWRQRARRIRSKRAGRILRFVEIKNCFALHRFLCVKKSARPVSLVLARFVAEDDEQGPISFVDRLESVLLSVKRKLQHARTFHFEISAENIRNRDLLRLGKRLEPRANLPTLVNREP